MSVKRCNLSPIALAALGVLFGAVLINPASHAQETMTLQPAQDLDVPEGSQIPEWRIDEAEEKVKAYKAEMRQRSLRQQEESSQAETAKPNGNE